MSINYEPGHKSTNERPGDDTEAGIYDAGYQVAAQVTGYDPAAHPDVHIDLDHPNNRYPSSNKDHEKDTPWWKKRVTAVVGATALLLGGGGATVVALNSGSHEGNTPSASGPETPGQNNGEHVQTVEYTMDNYPFIVEGQTYTGQAELKKKFALDGAAYTDAKLLAADTLARLSTWANSGSDKAEKDRSGDTDGTLDKASKFYDPAFEGILFTTPGEALAPGAPGLADDGIIPPDQLKAKVQEFHRSSLKFDDIKTTFEAASDIEILSAFNDTTLKTGADGGVNHVTVQINKVSIVQQGIDVTNTGQKWNFTLWRVPNESGEGSHWAIVSFKAVSN